MKLGQLLSIFSVSFNLMSLSAFLGFWAYLFYMAFSLNLVEQTLILSGLLVAFKLFRLLGSAVYQTLKEGEWPKLASFGHSAMKEGEWLDKEENEE